MTIDKINITESLKNVESLLSQEKGISPALKTAIELLVVVVQLLVNKLGINSSNSSKPPSQDPNRKKPKKNGNGKPKGGQKGHKGETLKPFPNPDEVIDIPIDRNTLPEGQYHSAGFDTRQTVDISLSRHVVEYRAEILENEKGEKFAAPFPADITNPVQYGNQLNPMSELKTTLLTRWESLLVKDLSLILTEKFSTNLLALMNMSEGLWLK